MDLTPNFSAGKEENKGQAEQITTKCDDFSVGTNTVLAVMRTCGRCTKALSYACGVSAFENESAPDSYKPHSARLPQITETALRHPVYKLDMKTQVNNHTAARISKYE
jgi:hypothetical protein